MIKITKILFSAILLFLFFPNLVSAATIPYSITTGIYETWTPTGETFLTTDFDVNYQGGQIILGEFADGTGVTRVDDAISISVTRPDGTTESSTTRYDGNCTYIHLNPPLNFTSLFKPGLNKVQVKLMDICGAYYASSSLYLVNTNAPDPTPPKTPVIFIPGIGGSEFKTKDTILWSMPDSRGGTYNHTYPADEKVWVNEDEGRALGNDDYFDILGLNPDGITSPVDLTLIEDNIYSGAYGDTIKFFTDNGYKLNQDLFVFPYDWRKDIAKTFPLLDQKITNIKNLTGSQKVDIVSHSMGGLVARNYINDPVKAQDVRKLVTLGAPYLGTTFFLKNLIYGGCLSKPWLDSLNLPFCLGIPDSEIKDILRNMISGYELAPSQKYYNFYNGSDNNHPIPFVDNRDVDNNGVIGFLSYQQLKTTLTNLSYNTALFNPAETFHNLDNNLNNLNGVDASIITGSGQATTGQIIEDYHLNFAGIKIPKTDIRKINGDDTVPLFSASLTDGVKTIAGTAIIYYTNQRHSDLVFDGPAMNLVKNILSGDSSLPSEVSTTAYRFQGTGLSSHSPVLIHAYDQNNNHTGPLPNGDYETNIPGSSYEVLGDAKFIWLPDGGTYIVKFEATDQGSFDFKIRNYKDDVNDKTILYKDVPLTKDTEAETTFDTAATTPPILQIDADGNGITDFQVNDTSILTGDASYDQTAPTTIIKLTGTTGNNSWYKSDVIVELNATDETNGSGILKTEYSLDNGQTIQTYTEPFTISQEGINKLKVKSTDNAGNEENPQEIEIKIDKTSPEVNISFDLQTSQFKTIGLDNLTPTQVNQSSSEINIADEAGNTTKLQLKSQDSEQNHDEDKDEKEDEKDEEENKLRIINISYNANSPIQLPKNEFAVDMENDKRSDNIKKFEQKIEIKNQIEINTDFNPRKNITKLQTKQKGSKEQKLEKEGIIFLELLTNQGIIEVKY
ncbi:MAG: hypothetical protein WCV81_01585 [Microgenomates group bacterium]